MTPGRGNRVGPPSGRLSRTAGDEATAINGRALGPPTPMWTCLDLVLLGVLRDVPGGPVVVAMWNRDPESRPALAAWLAARHDHIPAQWRPGARASRQR